MNTQPAKQNNGRLLPSKQKLHFCSVMKCIVVLSARQLTPRKCRLFLQSRQSQKFPDNLILLNSVIPFSQMSLYNAILKQSIILDGILVKT